MFDIALDCLTNQKKLPKDELDGLCNFLFHKQAWHLLADIGLLHDNMRGESAQWRIIYGLISQNPQELELLFFQGGMQNKELLSNFLAEYQLADAFMQNIVRTQNPELWQFTLTMPHFQNNQTNHNDQLLSALGINDEYMTFLAHWQTFDFKYNGLALYHIAQFQTNLGYGDYDNLLLTLNQHFMGRAGWNDYDALRFAQPNNHLLPILNKPFYVPNAINRPLPPRAGHYGDGDSPNHTLNFVALKENFAHYAQQCWANHSMAAQNPTKIIILYCPDEHITQTTQHYYDTNHFMLMTDYVLNQDPLELYYALYAMANRQDETNIKEILQRYMQSRLAEYYYCATHKRTMVLTHINDLLFAPIWAGFNAQIFFAPAQQPSQLLTRLYSTEGDIMPFGLPPMDNNQTFTRPARTNARIYYENWHIIAQLVQIYNGKTIDIADICGLMGIRDNEIFSKMTNISPYLPLSTPQKGQLHDYLNAQNPLSQ